MPRVFSKELASKCGVSEMTIRRILDPKHNPTTDNVEKVAEALGVHEQYIYETEAESKSKQPINGYIEYGGTISSIKTFKQLEKVYEGIKYDMNVPRLAKELRAKDKENKKSQTKTEIDNRISYCHSMKVERQTYTIPSCGLYVFKLMGSLSHSY